MSGSPRRRGTGRWGCGRRTPPTRGATRRPRFCSATPASWAQLRGFRPMRSCQVVGSSPAASTRRSWCGTWGPERVCRLWRATGCRSPELRLIMATLCRRPWIGKCSCFGFVGVTIRAQESGCLYELMFMEFLFRMFELHALFCRKFWSELIKIDIVIVAVDVCLVETGVWIAGEEFRIYYIGFTIVIHCVEDLCSYFMSLVCAIFCWFGMVRHCDARNFAWRVKRNTSWSSKFVNFNTSISSQRVFAKKKNWERITWIFCSLVDFYYQPL